jgi:hypothetical protein
MMKILESKDIDIVTLPNAVEKMDISERRNFDSPISDSIRSADELIIPIHLKNRLQSLKSSQTSKIAVPLTNGDHWMLALVDKTTQKIEYFDSKGIDLDTRMQQAFFKSQIDAISFAYPSFEIVEVVPRGVPGPQISSHSCGPAIFNYTRERISAPLDSVRTLYLSTHPIDYEYKLFQVRNEMRQILDTKAKPLPVELFNELRTREYIPKLPNIDVPAQESLRPSWMEGNWQHPTKTYQSAPSIEPAKALASTSRKRIAASQPVESGKASAAKEAKTSTLKDSAKQNSKQSSFLNPSNVSIIAAAALFVGSIAFLAEQSQSNTSLTQTPECSQVTSLTADLSRLEAEVLTYQKQQNSLEHRFFR